MKKYFAVPAVMTLALGLTACSSGSGNTGAKDGEKPAQVLNLSKENDVITMDSTLATDGMSFEVINMCIEGLETTNENADIVPALAESYDVSDDDLTYTFHLRDAKWSNGDPVTAADFEYAWKDAATDPTCDYAYIFGSDGACIKGADEAMGDPAKKDEIAVKAVDDKTLEVTLSRKTPYFVSLTTFPPFYPVNEKFAEEQGDQYGLSPDNLLYCGPFKLDEWVKGNSLKLSKNADYWGADDVALEEININIVPEPSSAALAYENGTTDYARLNSSLVDKYKDNEAYDTFLEGYLWYLQFNLNNKYLDNANLRKAIGTVVDRDNLVNNVLKDGSINIGGFVPQDFTTGPDGKDYRATADKFYTEVGEDGLKAAQEYWDKAKKELGVDKITLKLLYEPSDPAKPAAEFIQSEIQKLDGITIEMVSQEKENRIEKQKARDFDIVLTRWGPDYADPTTYLNLMITGNSYNYGDYHSEAYDAKMEEAANAATPEERWTALQEAEKILMEDSPVVGVFQVGGAALKNPKVTGIEDHSFGVPYIYKNVKIEE